MITFILGAMIIAIVVLASVAGIMLSGESTGLDGARDFYRRAQRLAAEQDSGLDGFEAAQLCTLARRHLSHEAGKANQVGSRVVCEPTAAH